MCPSSSARILLGIPLRLTTFLVTKVATGAATRHFLRIGSVVFAGLPGSHIRVRIQVPQSTFKPLNYIEIIAAPLVSAEAISLAISASIPSLYQARFGGLRVALRVARESTRCHPRNSCKLCPQPGPTEEHRYFATVHDRRSTAARQSLPGIKRPVTRLGGCNGTATPDVWVGRYGDAARPASVRSSHNWKQWSRSS